MGSVGEGKGPEFRGWAEEVDVPLVVFVAQLTVSSMYKERGDGAGLGKGTLVPKRFPMMEVCGKEP